MINLKELLETTDKEYIQLDGLLNRSGEWQELNIIHDKQFCIDNINSYFILNNLLIVNSQDNKPHDFSIYRIKFNNLL